MWALPRINQPLKNHMHERLNRTLLAQAALLMAGGCVTALAAGPDAGSLLRQQQQNMPRESIPLPKPDARPLEPLAPTAPGGQSVSIKRVEFSGAQGLASEEELQSIVQPALGKPLNFAGLEQLADTVTRYLKDRGWLLARAYLPMQDLTDGRLEIAISPGRIERDANGAGIDIQGSTSPRVNRERVLETLRQSLALDSERALRSADLERAVLLINDTPGVEVTSSLERGRTPGTTRLALEVRDTPQLTGSAWVDNHGNRYTGSTRANGVAQINSPFGWGDQFSLFHTRSQGVEFSRSGYSLPLGFDGWRANAAYSTMTYAIGKEQKQQRSKGTGEIGSAGLSYPLLRSRPGNVTVNLNHESKRLRDETLGSNTRDKSLQTQVLSLSGDQTDTWLDGGFSTWSLSVTSGQLDLSRNPTDLENDAIYRTQGHYHKLNATLTRLQRINRSVTLFAGLSAQQADKNLDTSEKFILGGPAGLRAYPSGEGSGDNGWLASLELRHEVQALRAWGLGDFQVIGFYDLGGVQLQHTPSTEVPPSNATQRNRYQLSGAGLGINLTRPGNYSMRLAWSRALSSNPGRSALNGTNTDGQADKSRLWLSATFNF